MTLVIGIRCKNGLLMVADSMSTETPPHGAGGGALTRHEVDKIVVQKELLWGASGSSGTKQVVQEAINQYYGRLYVPDKSPTVFRQTFIELIGPIINKQYEAVQRANQAAGHAKGDPG